MQASLTAIERSCLRTGAGLKQIAIVNPDDLLVQPDWHIVPTTAELQFAPGKAAFLIWHSIHTARLEDDTLDADPGDSFSYRLSAFIRLIRGEVDTLRAALANRRVHVIVTYKNGEQRILPYMRLRMEADSGAKYGADKPGYSLKGSARYEYPAPWLDGDFNLIGEYNPDTPPATPGESVVVVVTTSDDSATYALPGGVLLTAVWVQGTAAQSPMVGLTDGGEELGGPVLLGANQGHTFAQALRTTGITTIYVTGLNGTNTIELWYIA